MKREPDFSRNEEQSIKSLTIPLWAIWPILVAFVSGTAYLVTLLNTINTKIDRATSDRWSKSHMRQYGYELRQDNPSLKAPDVDAIAQRLGSP